MGVGPGGPRGAAARGRRPSPSGAPRALSRRDKSTYFPEEESLARSQRRPSTKGPAARDGGSGAPRASRAPEPEPRRRLALYGGKLDV